jgi:hypothetical protein
VEIIAGFAGADGVAVAGRVKGRGWGPRTILARGQWTKRGKAATEWKKTESWQDRIMRSEGRIIAGRAINGGAV